MSDEKPKRRWLSFSIRDMLWLIALSAILVASWLERARLAEKVNEYEWLLRDEREKRVAAEGSKAKMLEAAERFRGFSLHGQFSAPTPEDDTPTPSPPAPKLPKE